MSAKLSIKKTYSYRQKETQEKANNQLRTVVNEISASSPEYFWRIRDQNDQDDRGVDFEIELENKTTQESIIIFKIQNKGEGKELEPLTSTNNKGKIAFPLKIKHAKYYRNDLNLALVFVVCDTANNIIYWHPIQLDSEVDKRVEEAVKAKKKSIQIYLDPNRKLEFGNVSEFVKAVFQSTDRQLRKTVFLKGSEMGGFAEQVKNLFPIAINVNGHICDQLEEFVMKGYSELSYIPLNLLLNQLPFTISENFTPYYSEFSISSNNPLLNELLNKIKIEKHKIVITDKKYFRSVKAPEKSLTKIFMRLNRNLIFHIEDDKKHTVHDISLKQNGNCKCEHCNFNQLKFDESFLKLRSVSNSNIQHKFRAAYIEYQIGRYLNAFHILKALQDETKNKGLKILYSIATYNLKKLHIFIRNHYYGLNAQDEIVKSIKGINLKNEFYLVSDQDNEVLLDYILNQKYYHDAKENIHSILNKIRDHYSIYIGGGYSSNSNVRELINAYSQIDSFLHNNYVFFDRFAEYSELTNAFIEGLIASHSIKDEYNSRLVHFDDWMIHKMIFYGKAEAILKYANSYNLKSIKIRSEKNSRIEIYKIASNFLNSSNSCIQEVQTWNEPERNSFRDRYSTIFSNLLAVLSLAELSTNLVNEIAEKIIKYCSVIKFLNRNYLKYVQVYVLRKSSQLNPETLENFIHLGLNNAEFHDENYFENITDVARKRNLRVDMTEESFKLLLQISSDKCALCGHKHSKNILIYFHRIVASQGFKDTIIKEIVNVLDTKFDEYLYYMASIFDVIPYDKKYFDIFLDKMKPTDKTTSFRSVFTGVKETRFNGLDMVLNLSYKYNLDLSDKKFDSIRNLNLYYQWLFSLESFDYNKFEPKWITYYPTKYYFKKFNGIPELKNRIVQFLKENRSPTVERDFISILYYSSDEK